MALPPTDKTDEAFLREVDEELRRDQLVQLWKRWGKLAVGVVVVALAAFAIMLLMNARAEQRAGAQGEQFDKALDDLKGGRDGKAEAGLKTLADSGGAGYRALAKLAQAAVYAEKKDTKRAVALLAEIAGDSGQPRPMRDLALIRQTTIEFDNLKPEVVIDRLKELAVPASPWFGSAGELVAAAYLQQGKRDLAGKLYAELAKSEKVPGSIHQRGVQMASVLGIDTTGQTGEKKAR